MREYHDFSSRGSSRKRELVHSFQFCFQGSGRFSELNPEDPVANEELVIDLLTCVAGGFGLLMIIEEVEIEFLYLDNQFLICMSLQLFTHLEHIDLIIENIVGKAMLQIFSEIAFVDDPNF